MSTSTVFAKAKPYIAVIFLQFLLSGMDIISKAALNEGLNSYVFVVYRHAIATIVMAPFAIILDKLEKFKLKSIRTHAKIGGTLTTVGGVMLMTLVKGPVIDLVWTNARHHQLQQSGELDPHHSVKGSVMITLGCLGWACFNVLQGVFCSGLAYYLQGMIMKDRGPVFVTAFSPLNMIIVAVLGYLILGEQIYLGKVIGVFVIVAGLYLVAWGKSKDYKSKSLSDDKRRTGFEQESNKVITINELEMHWEAKRRTWLQITWVVVMFVLNGRVARLAF